MAEFSSLFAGVDAPGYNFADRLKHSVRIPAPSVFLEKFGESSIHFELVVWTREMSSRPRRYRSDLNFAIEKHLRAAGIEIPNPQRDLHIRGGVLKVKLMNSEQTEVGRHPTS